jgi:two-component system response regulator MtrA
MSEQRVLLVEDDDELAAQVSRPLEREGFLVHRVASAEAALEVSLSNFSVAVLDIMLPGMDGLSLLKRWREVTDVPVLILTARGDPESRVRGLNLGGDDYLTKPFWPGELVARVRARLRRPLLARAHTVVIGALTIDFLGPSVSLRGEPLELTPAERTILIELARRHGAAVTRKRLVEFATRESSRPPAS